MFEMRDHSDRFWEHFLPLISGSTTRWLYGDRALPQTCERLQRAQYDTLDTTRCNPNRVPDVPFDHNMCSSNVSVAYSLQISSSPPEIIITQRLRVQETMLCHNWHAVMSHAQQQLMQTAQPLPVFRSICLILCLYWQNLSLCFDVSQHQTDAAGVLLLRRWMQEG